MTIKEDCSNLPLISIVIVNWNGQKWLEKCLSSLTAQNYPYIEIIVVDNDSTDNSTVAIHNQFPDIHVVVNHENLGFANGVNRGIQQANGRMILLLNTDAYLDKTAVHDLYEELVVRSLDVIGPIEVPYNFKGPLANTYNLSNIDLLGHPVSNAKKSFYLSGVCLLFSKDTYIETGGLDNNFFMYVEEVDWFWRMILMKKSYASSNITMVYHAGAGSTQDSSISEKIFLWRNTNTLQMLLKNYSYKFAILFIVIYVLQNIIEIVVFFLIFKPNISKTYVQAWKYCIVNFSNIMVQRKFVQNKRIVSDADIIRCMYHGSAKIKHLVSRIKLKYKT